MNSLMMFAWRWVVGKLIAVIDWVAGRQLRKLLRKLAIPLLTYHSTEDEQSEVLDFAKKIAAELRPGFRSLDGPPAAEAGSDAPEGLSFFDPRREPPGRGLFWE